MNFKQFNDAFSKKYSLNEGSKIYAYSDYTQNHNEEAPTRHPALEVSKDNFETQLRGEYTKERGKVRKFFDEHPHSDFAIIKQDELEENLDEVLRGLDEDLEKDLSDPKALFNKVFNIETAALEKGAEHYANSN